MRSLRICQFGVLMYDAVEASQHVTSEQSGQALARCDPPQGTPERHFKPVGFPHIGSARQDCCLYFCAQFGLDHLIRIQEEHIIAGAVLQQPIALLGKSLPVGVGVDLGPQLLCQGYRVVFAAAVDHDDFVGKQGTADAGLDPSFLVHREDTDGQAWLLGGVHGFHWIRPHRRPHMRVTSRGEGSSSRTGRARAVPSIRPMRRLWAWSTPWCLLRKISFDCAWW